MASPPQKLPGRMMKIQKEQKNLLCYTIAQGKVSQWKVWQAKRRFLDKTLSKLWFIVSPINQSNALYKEMWCVPENKGSSFCTIRNATTLRGKDAQHLDNDTPVSVLSPPCSPPPGHRNFSSNRYSRSPLSTLLPNAAVCSCCFLISSDAVVVPFELRCKSSNKLASIVVFLLLASRLLPSSVRYPHLHFILVLLKL